MENRPKLFTVERRDVEPVAKIKVIGVGGAGGNAINRMIQYGLKGVDFIAANTDAQDLQKSRATKKIVLGEKLNGGLGAGANAQIGIDSAIESEEQIKQALADTDLLFITAGMGGGTGTGAAPEIARIARNLNEKMLIISVVTKPFDFEGNRRMRNATEGITRLREYTDAIIVIPNDKILESEELSSMTISMAFATVDDVLRQAIQGISDMLVIPGEMNLDFRDLETTIRNKGLAHIGIGEGTGREKIRDAVQGAVNSRLLESTIQGATNLIVSLAYSESALTAAELKNCQKDILNIIGNEVDLILGMSVLPDEDDVVRVVLIATGMEENNGGSGRRPNNSGMENPIFRTEPVTTDRQTGRFNEPEPIVRSERRERDRKNQQDSSKIPSMFRNNRRNDQ